VEFLVAMRRIQKFIFCEEINPKIIEHISVISIIIHNYLLQKEESNYSVQIIDGNFFWGIKNLKEDLEDKKKKHDADK
jgi:hypothetical protein